MESAGDRTACFLRAGGQRSHLHSLANDSAFVDPLRQAASLCGPSANNARFDQCVQDTIGQYKWEAKQSYEKVLAGGIVAFVFTWLVIALYRWVRRGFVKELER